MTALARKCLIGLLELIVVLGGCVFLPAWTLRYWQGWVFLGNFLFWSFLVVGYLLAKDRELLLRRMKAGVHAEKETRQKWLIAFIRIGFIGLIVVPPFDHRFGWSRVPISFVVVGNVLVALGYFIIILVMRENSFASSTVEVIADQKVISTGPYAIVRHPMYAGAIIMFAGIPLALGSWYGLLFFAPLTITIVWRLLDEENLLTKNLPGYTDYRTKVRCRLLPMVW